MIFDDQLGNAAARCVSILRRYHDDGRTEATTARMVAEVDTVVGWLMELDLPPGAVESEVIRPVEDYLLARHGHEAGQRLSSEFVDAFERTGLRLLVHPAIDEAGRGPRLGPGR